MISPKKIAYANKTNFSFPTFDLLCDLVFDGGDSGETTTGLNREIIAAESYNGRFKYATGAKYNETLAPQITLIKADYSDLTLAEQRQILSWLTSKNSPSFMDIYDDPDSNVIIYSLLGVPTSIETYKLANNRTVGITFTFECVSPFAFSRAKTLTQVVSAPATFTITSDSDDTQHFVYPKITVTEDATSAVVSITSTMASNIFSNDNYLDGTVYYDGTNYYYKNSSGQNVTTTTRPTVEYTSVRIINETTSQECWVKKNSTGDVIVIDGANRVIASVDRVFSDNFSWSWLGLVPGVNSIKVIGNCSVTFEWRDLIKCGQVV